MRPLPIALVTLSIVGLSAGGYLYWQHSARYPNTDDAYVNANSVRIAPLVAGRVVAVFVRNQQHVAKHAALFDIDQDSYVLALKEAEAKLAIAKQDAASALGALRAAEADLKNREILLDNARTNSARTRHLVAQGFLSHQSGDDAKAAEKSAAAQVTLAEAKVYEARMALGQSGEQNEHVRQALTAVGKAQLDLERTHVRAPCDGYIAESALRPGDTVNENTPVFALICAQEYWIDANFKETELERIRPGQPAEIRVDMYPGKTFKGRVESIGGAAGTAFSLLPPQNATGNWVKVTQRVPVRVLVTEQDPKFPLRVGTSAIVVIDTTALDAH
jgi:membrane fusion protein (multidrug efflux system)